MRHGALAIVVAASLAGALRAEAASEVADAVSPSGDEGSIAEDPNLHVIDLERANPMHASIEDLVHDRGSIAGSTIRPGAAPVGRDDPFDRRPITGHPGLRENLLQLCEHDLVLNGRHETPRSKMRC